MLQSFRTIINSLVGKVFFAVLLGTFALLGVGYGFRDLVLGATRSNDAAKIGGDVISLSQLQTDYRRQLQSQQRRLGGAFNPTAREKQEIAQAALDKDVDDALFAEAAARDGFRVSDVMLREIIEGERAFASSDGRFDTAHFRMLLENQGLSEGAFVAAVREDIAKQMVINPVAGSASAPKFLAEDIYRYRNEQRVAEIVTLPHAAAANVAQPADSDIAAYYNAHAADFTAPEYRTFTVLALPADLFAGEINPTEDELHTAYDQHKSDYVVPEKRKITQVIVSDRATAEQVAKAAQSGKSLADSAKTAPDGKAQAIALEFLTRAEFPEALREPTFSAAKAAIVGPVQTTLGWHVLQVNDIQPGHEVPFEEVKAKLAAQLKHDGSVDRLAEQIDKIGDRLSGGAPIDAVADSVGAKALKIGPIDAKGGLEAPSKPGEDIAKPNPAWVAEAFRLQPGETSQFRDSPDGGYFAVRLEGKTPPALRPQADVRADIIAAWTAERKTAQIAKRADELAAEARGGAPMARIASEAGVKLETTAPLLRDPSANKLAVAPPAVVNALFQLSKVGDVVAVDVGDAHVVARLSEIKQADPNAAGADLAPITRELDASLAADDQTQYRAGLQRGVKVKINPDAVATVVGQ